MEALNFNSLRSRRLILWLRCQNIQQSTFFVQRCLPSSYERLTSENTRTLSALKDVAPKNGQEWNHKNYIEETEFSDCSEQDTLQIYLAETHCRFCADSKPSVSFEKDLVWFTELLNKKCTQASDKIEVLSPKAEVLLETLAAFFTVLIVVIVLMQCYLLLKMLLSDT